MRHLLTALEKKAIVLSILVAYLGLMSYLLFSKAISSPSDTIIANSPSLKDVQAAIKKAKIGDTIIVPAGIARWGSALIIDKGIILKAEIPGSVTIINDTPITDKDHSFNPENYVIAYCPKNEKTGQPFRLSGFIVDGGKNRWLFLGKARSATMVITQFRVDHCVFQNGYRIPISFRGEIYGVIDNNVIHGSTREFAFNKDTWENLTFNFGTENNRYYEDNVIYTYAGDTAPEGGLGGRYCFRYNTFNHLSTSGANPWFDMHGNMGPGGNHGTMGAEIYGNVIYCNGKSLTMFDHRGGKLIAFNNTAYDVKGINGAKAREEYLDSLNPPETNPAGQPQHVCDSYYWNHIANGSVIYDYHISKTVGYEGTVGIVPRWDVHCFKQVENFDGSSGIGVGPLVQRPVSCTTEGVGWWATDESKLYRWKNGRWELYYTPYTYPHPLRTSLGD
jgi:hypothetical protein